MEQKIRTRFTEFFRVPHPVMSAPMDKVSGGKLAAAVSRAGGLGTIGGGYGDEDFISRAFTDAGNQSVGIGVITWSVLDKLDVVDMALSRNPALFITSFGEAGPIVQLARSRNIPTAWQVQRLEQAKQALAAGVDVIIAQGQEAGGHAMDRGLFSLVPAIRDLAGPDQIIMAAGGIADGRGLAAALMLGADGVMMGTRFFACTEAEGSDQAKAIMVNTGGDQTHRSKIFDIARGLDWLDAYTGRVIENDFARHWKNDLTGLKQKAASQQSLYRSADAEDFNTRAIIAGEALDLIHEIKHAGDIVHEVITEASSLMRSSGNFLV